MPAPRPTDDGSTVTLDLHGTRVDEAVRMAARLVEIARARGRMGVRLIHGTSTSDPRARNRTIKHALHDLLDEGLPAVASDFRTESVLHLSLVPTGRTDPRPVRLADLAP